MVLKIWHYPNWGDAINEELFRLISGKKPEIVQADKICEEPNYLMVGSILQYADKNSIVWGSGFLREDDYPEAVPKVLSVRGPKTRQRLLEIGIDCPENYGDPVLVLPRFYKPKRKIKYKLGIVPHWRDEFHPFFESFTNSSEVIKIPASLGSYAFIDLINSCERIASSSLHGIICADAYGIPAIHIEFLDQEQFKFEDYCSSVNRPFNKIKFESIEQVNNSFFKYKLNIDATKILSTCPFRRKIVISPYSRALRNGKRNPKNYPHWKEVVNLLHHNGYYVTQIGVDGEDSIGADEFVVNAKLEHLEKILKDSHTWISIDTFLPHLAHLIGKRGITVFGKSDPEIFGYKENVNLLKDRKYLRPLPFDIWEREEYNGEVFVKPQIIINHVDSL